jgi:triosephosphate isomerase
MKPLIVANWKMNPPSLKEAERLFAAVKNIKGAQVVICPPFIYLSTLKTNGAQDVFWKDGGAYTGEVSPMMLKNMGVKYVIIGHSERRKHLKETDEMVNRKIKAVLKRGLRPILCVDKISQIKKGLRGVSKKELKKLILAYEPIFAIGTGKPCTIKRAKRMNVAAKRVLGIGTSILYGGSVNPKNVRGYIAEAGFNGLLVGGASLKPKEFIDIIKNVCYR